MIRQPEILVICPPPVVIPADNKPDPRMVNATQMFRELPSLYQEVAIKNGCHFLNAGDHIQSSTIDGYHLDPEAHHKLAMILRDYIVEKMK